MFAIPWLWSTLSANWKPAALGIFNLDGRKCRDCDTKQIKSKAIAVAPAYACVYTCGVAPEHQGVPMSDCANLRRNAARVFLRAGRSVTLQALGGYEGYGSEDVR